MSRRPSTSGIVEPAWVPEVLHFWFDELGDAYWFAKREDIDLQIRGRFLALHERLLAHGSVATRQLPLLAAVIVLDQFSRNLWEANYQSSRDWRLE
jgi:uncharacterized protein (DUF924 family)